MTYYGGKELAASFRTVRNNTIQIAEEIPEESYSFRPSPDSRSIGQTLAHIATLTGFQTFVHEHQIDSLTKVNFPEYLQQARATEDGLRTKAEIIAALKADGEKFSRFVENLPESTLAQPVAMMPGAEPAAKSRFEMLLSAKEHEMHHRGQLMVMQRMLGMTPHLTRQMQERMARQAAQAQATAAR
jgi:uncharacterized damage-inducible protein DinB